MTTITPWPSVSDYSAALQHPQLVFGYDNLRMATFDRDGWGTPESAAGSNAVVFKATIGASPRAIRCFTSSAGLSQGRYEVLAQHRSSREVPSLVDARWRQEAIKVHRVTWPIVEMEWVDGRTLDEYVGYLCEREPGALDQLAEEWRQLLVELAAGEVAHGDLQHGNVLVDQSAALRLVDLDGVWVSTTSAAAPPNEYGHPAYRHPDHVGPEFWGPLMDVFPGALIYATIRALHADPGLWNRYNNGANLLFAPDDLRQPGNTPIWHDMRQVRSAEVGRLMDLLAECCGPGWRPDVSADELLASVDRAPSPPPFASVPAVDDELPWQMEPAEASVAPTPIVLPPPPPPDVHVVTPRTSAVGRSAVVPSWFDEHPAQEEGVGTTPTSEPAKSGGINPIVWWLILAALVALVIWRAKGN